MDRCVALLGALVLFLAACGAAADETAAPVLVDDGSVGQTATTVAEVEYGPFLIEDRFDVVVGLAWLDLSPALVDGPIETGGPVAVLMDDSTPDSLRIAVNGGGCVPRVGITVLQPPPALQLGIEVGDNIATPGYECAALLTTHGFELRLSEPASLDEVAFNPVLTEGGEHTLIILPEVDGSPSGEVMLSCQPGGRSFPARSLRDIPTVESIDLPPLIPEMQRFFSEGEGLDWPQDGWRALDQNDERVLIVRYDTTTDGLRFIDFEYQDGSLRWARTSVGGACPLQIRLPEDLGAVTWRLDPDAEPLSPESTSISVLVTEMVCAGGQPMGDRLVGPEVAMTDTEVLIVFAAEPPNAGECPGNPETPVVVELPEPLGDRTPRDGLDTGLNLTDFLE